MCFFLSLSALFAMEINVTKNLLTGESTVLSTATVPTEELNRHTGLKVFDDGRKCVYALNAQVVLSLQHSPSSDLFLFHIFDLFMIMYNDKGGRVHGWTAEFNGSLILQKNKDIQEHRFIYPVNVGTNMQKTIIIGVAQYPQIIWFPCFSFVFVDSQSFDLLQYLLSEVKR